jgi:hypothetical protein
MLIISNNHLVLFVMFMISVFTADGDDPWDSQKVDLMVINNSDQMSSGKHLRVLPSTTVNYWMYTNNYIHKMFIFI